MKRNCSNCLCGFSVNRDETKHSALNRMAYEVEIAITELVEVGW